MDNVLKIGSGVFCTNNREEIKEELPIFMAYKQRWLEYFELLDIDKSGFVDLADLDNAIKVNLYFFLFSIYVKIIHSYIYIHLKNTDDINCSQQTCG